MADRSGGSFVHTCFSSAVSATSGAGSGVRAAAGSALGGRSDESPQAAKPEAQPAGQGGEHRGRVAWEPDCNLGPAGLRRLLLGPVSGIIAREIAHA